MVAARRRRPGDAGARVDGEAEPRFRRDIEGLRAVAVAVVVLHHTHAPRFRGGFIGVDVFFITEARCPTIMRDVLVYRDRAHVTAHFARSLRSKLAYALGPRLRAEPPG